MFDKRIHLQEKTSALAMKKTKIFFLNFIILAVVLSFVSTKAYAADPSITDILITNDAQNVLLYARLVNGFKPEMETAILAGIPAVFAMHVEVYQERPLLWDKKISAKEIKRTLKYDNLKKVFNIYHSSQSDPVAFPDLESAKKAMSDFNGIIVTPLSSLVKGGTYYVLVTIKMDKVRLPLRMEYVLFFVSFWDFETPWYRQNFSY
jgi:hypothetical protein